MAVDEAAVRKAVAKGYDAEEVRAWLEAGADAGNPPKKVSELMQNANAAGVLLGRDPRRDRMDATGRVVQRKAPRKEQAPGSKPAKGGDSLLDKLSWNRYIGDERVEAAAKGAKEGALSGYSFLPDVGAGIGDAIAVRRNPGVPGTSDVSLSISREVDKHTEDNARTAEKHPGYFYGGTMVGSMAGLPGQAAKAMTGAGSRAAQVLLGRTAGRAAGNAASGAVVGAGESAQLGGDAGDGAFYGAAGGAAGDLIASGAGAVVKKLRDARTQRGRNIRAVEDVGGKVGISGAKGNAIDEFAEGEYGIGEAAHRAAKKSLDHIDTKRNTLSVAFEQGENKLMRAAGGVRLDASGVRDSLKKSIDKMVTSDGRPIPGLDTKTLIEFDALLSQPEGVQVQDLVKIRRALDQAGNAGKLAGIDDVPFRKAAGEIRSLLSNTNHANPAVKELAQHMRQHHENLNKLEQAHGALLLREEAALPDAQSFTERATARIGRYGASDLQGKAREEAIDKAMENVPEIAPGIKQTRAVRAREELRFKGSPVVSGSAARTGINLARSFGDAAAARIIYPAAKRIADSGGGAGIRSQLLAPLIEKYGPDVVPYVEELVRKMKSEPQEERR